LFAQFAIKRVVLHPSVQTFLQHGRQWANGSIIGLNNDRHCHVFVAVVVCCCRRRRRRRRRYRWTLTTTLRAAALISTIGSNESPSVVVSECSNGLPIQHCHHRHFRLSLNSCSVTLVRVRPLWLSSD